MNVYCVEEPYAQSLRHSCKYDDCRSMAQDRGGIAHEHPGLDDAAKVVQFRCNSSIGHNIVLPHFGSDGSKWPKRA